MPLLKCQSSKSTPQKVMAYITNPQKAEYISVQNLFVDEDYAKQFTETMRRFNKGEKYDERKYYHFKLSCDRKDKVYPQEAHLYAEELTARLFPDCECVIATHTDTKTVHSHIIVNAVHPIMGKKLRITRKDYTDMKDETNRLGVEMGFSEIDFRKKAEHKRTAEEKHIILKGDTSWKEELREVIEEAKQQTTTEEEFISHLVLYGITITRSKTEYSYLHPKKKKPIRGAKLGENYTKTEVLNVIDKNGRGTSGNTIGAVAGSERDTERRNGQRPAQRSVGDIERELCELDETAKYARRGLDGESERRKERMRELRERTNISRGQSDERTAEDIAGRETIQSGNKSNDKKRDYSFSK